MHPRCKDGCPRVMGYFQRHLSNQKGGQRQKISFVDYSDSKKVHLKPDIAEYAHNGAPPVYDLILGKQTLHDLGVLLDFKEKTITIDDSSCP